MDFTWVNEGQHPRKHPNLLQKSSNAPPSLASVRLSNDMDANNQPSARVSFNQSLESPLRRSRADTMPTQSSPFPYANDMFSASMSHLNDSVVQNSTMLPPPSSSAAAAAPPLSRHRSGSVTLPQTAVYNDTPFNTGYSNPYDPSSPIDENASNTIASTLASLGLDDENNNDYGAEDHSMPVRGRSYTVTGQLAGNDMNARLAFSPFSPHTRSSVLHRPRAISLGMADSFSPFDMSQVSATATTATAAIASPASSATSNPTRLRMQQSAETPLRSSRSSSNLVDMSMDPHVYSNMDDDYYGQPDGADSPTSAQAQIPSRALWLGNINPSISVPDLVQLFSTYGQVESARILSDKECAFVNFTTKESAVAAKNDLESRLGSKLGGTPVRVGFGKADVNLAMALTNEAGPNAQGPTRALWVGNIPANMNPAILRTIFQAFGAIESVRVLSHKNCGFINFDHQEDAVRARKSLQNKEILGPGTGAVRIGFAKVPPNNPDEAEEIPGTSGHVTPPLAPALLPTKANATTPQQQPSLTANGSENYQTAQWATAMMMTNMMMSASGQQQTAQPSLYTAIASERHLIMQQLGQEPSDQMKQDRVPLTYFSVIPAVPELGSDRKLEPLRLREMRKKLENDEQHALEDVEMVAGECMEEVVELCSDYIGNTVIQKLFEHCSEQTKLKMLEKIAPFLASIGVHKNGTWAAQKIIDYANTPEQIRLVRQHIAPYVPLLLLDQFGNYVVQCCLRKGPEQNQYIFDAIVDKCWEIGQGRFGARAVRAILENSIVTKEQQVYVAAAIVQNTVLLTTNANGVLLLTWFLDTSELPGRYRVLCPRLLPYLNKLSSHKLGSMTVYKVINQTEEPNASALLLNALSEKSKGDLVNNKK
ncbi:hypothetical protein V8B55DRAFT_1550767 [Mucor lusitanicus]|uniref:PUM-HD domain-containing protein n=2 Tax=Mucor circinelloides f. lusitanicus TaxID=29924 RepID=A0A8H4B9T5_MUCCL|nr:hypothetical protein FB192DRAFT_1397258 [Mucor lusitanicus]